MLKSYPLHSKQRLYVTFEVDLVFLHCFLQLHHALLLVPVRLRRITTFLQWKCRNVLQALALRPRREIALHRDVDLFFFAEESLEVSDFDLFLFFIVFEKDCGGMVWRFLGSIDSSDLDLGNQVEIVTGLLAEVVFHDLTDLTGVSLLGPALGDVEVLLQHVLQGVVAGDVTFLEPQHAKSLPLRNKSPFYAKSLFSYLFPALVRKFFSVGFLSFLWYKSHYSVLALVQS